MNSFVLEALVIGDDHYNTLNVIRSLGEMGIKVSVIVVSKKCKSFVLKSKYINDGCVVEKLDAKIIISNYAKQNKKIPILASSDTIASFLDTNYNILSDYFVLPSVGNIQGQLCFHMDKKIQLMYASKAGFALPYSIAVNLNNLDESDLSSINYPCIIKPEESIGGSKNDFRICKDLNELMKSLKSLSTHISRVLIQDFIPNDEVILIAGVRTNNKKNYIFGEVNKLKHGNKLNNLGLNCMGVLYPKSELSDACIKIVEAIDYHGCYSVDVVRSRSESDTTSRCVNYFMEINLRTDGLLYFYDKAGINYPAIWVKSCYNIEDEIIPKKNDIYGMNEFLYVKNYFSLALIKDLFKTDIFSTFRMNDLKPFFYKILYRD